VIVDVYVHPRAPKRPLSFPALFPPPLLREITATSAQR
jgi:hypothetical protein